MYYIPTFIRKGTYTKHEVEECHAVAYELINEDPLMMGEVIDHCIDKMLGHQTRVTFDDPVT